MSSKTAILINSWVIVIVAMPLVWMIGYQDHRWRSTGLATLAAALLIGASAALVIAARTEDRQATTAGWPLVALAVSSVSLLLAWFWGLMG